MTTGSSSPQSDTGVRASGQGLLHPCLLAAVVVLGLNDHLLKQSYPCLITGKLSDVAGLIFFPAFLQGLIEIVMRRPRWRGSQKLLIATTVATAAVFACVKALPMGGEVYRAALGVLSFPLQVLVTTLHGQHLHGPVHARLVTDWTDLLALPAVLLPLHLDRKRRRRVRPSPGTLFIGGASALLIGAWAPEAHAEPYLRASLGIGVVNATAMGRVSIKSPGRAASAGYSVDVVGVGPTLELALGAHGSRWAGAFLVEGGAYRGHSSGHTAGLSTIGAAVDSSILTWFMGPMAELQPRPGSVSVGFAVGFAGLRSRFEGAQVVDENAPNLWGNAYAAKLWLTGNFNVRLPDHLTLGWHCVGTFAAGTGGLLGNPNDKVGAQSLLWLFDLGKY
jgi:hypothetical protein